MMNTEYQMSPAWPHGEIKPIFKDIFFVTGTNKIHYQGADIQTSRNMVIIRDGKDLTLINTVRLNDNALQALDQFGEVKNIVRIGAFHDRDDTFYKSRYPHAVLWTLKGMRYDSGLTADALLTPEGAMPFPESSIFIYETSTQQEGAILLNREGGILVTCDSIQNVIEIDEFYDAETAKSLHEQGLVRSANISHIWLGATHTKAEDFQRLLRENMFKHLLTAHGAPLLNDAFEVVEQSIQFALETGTFKA